MPFLGSPITPDYIDQYHDSVLKYIRDIRSDESLDLTSDSSYITTVNLLFQRADQIAADVCGKELREMEQIVPKVLNKGYENIFAESTDPTYETIALPVEIISASNVRGIYMTDIARNISLDSVLNVTYHPGRGCFSIDETPPSSARVRPSPSSWTRPSPTTAASTWSSRLPKASPTV